MSVIPAVLAARKARAVGTETATRMGVPKDAAFCTISTETRLVSSSAPAAGGNDRAG